MLKLFIFRKLGLPVPTWGVWISNLGWVKGLKGAYATPDKTQARELARRVGGKVFYIDEVLSDIQQSLLDIERERAKEKHAIPDRFKR